MPRAQHGASQHPLADVRYQHAVAVAKLGFETGNQLALARGL